MGNNINSNKKKINNLVIVSRKKEFRYENSNYLSTFKNICFLSSISSVNYYIFYEIKNATSDELEIIKNNIFLNHATDEEISWDKLKSHPTIISKPLPLQFNARSDSAIKIAKLLTKNDEIVIESGEIWELNANVSKSDLQKATSYLINPLENFLYNFKADNTFFNQEWENKIIDNFESLSETDLKKLSDNLNLSLEISDLTYIQNYYSKNNLKINISELELFNIYWSDHCRHTTFNKIINNIDFSKTKNSLSKDIEKTFSEFISDNKEFNKNKPITLMNLATINSKILKNTEYFEKVMSSDEVNACAISFLTDNKEKYYFSFKNETHNHPTEIEPYGGAATCLGGAIRDILANRSFTFAGIRISGSADPFEKVNKTIAHKLPQRVISINSAKGFSSYGNQIGIPTIFVKEYIDPGYKAKHLECGAVLGVGHESNFENKTPLENDLIVLFGGRTGIDGIGGASGSSKSHSKTSTKNTSEVQKGNPIIEHKIQRLFQKNNSFSKLLKRCNDFGAGGASVAIGEIANSVVIYLDKFLTKYEQMNPYQILFSESQERMAAVIEPKDLDLFIKYCKEENLEGYVVGKVTNNNTFVAKYNDIEIVNINKNFLATNGADKTIDLQITQQKIPTNYYQPLDIFQFRKEFQDIKNYFDKGLVEMFDSSIGLSSVNAPFGGKFQLTKEETPIARIPIKEQEEHCAVVGVGFDPFFSPTPYHLGYYSVLESISKVVSRGGKLNNIYLSMQEYFPKINNSKLWQKVFLTMLGAYKAMKDYKVAAIGGKDSMSGSFKNIDVPATLISFAFSVDKLPVKISNTIQSNNSNLYLIELPLNKNLLFDAEKNISIFNWLSKEITDNRILSCSVLSQKGVLSTIIENALGNMINFQLNYDDIFSKKTGSFIIETNQEYKESFAKLIGKTLKSEKTKIYNVLEFDLKQIILERLNFLNDSQMYLPYSKIINNKSKVSIFKQRNSFLSLNKKECKVLIPVFPGTNCEFNLSQAFVGAKAKVELFIFKDLTIQDIEQSLKELENKIYECDIFAIPGGFSLGDEPDGSGKYIANILKTVGIQKALRDHLKNKKLILGICNGFQALVAAGLLPKVNFENNEDSSLITCDLGRHVSTIATVKTTSVNSPWLSEKFLNKTSSVPVSNTEGKFWLTDELFSKLNKNGQIFSVYEKTSNNTIFENEETVNLSGSKQSIEGIISEDGLILGRMGHPERINKDLYKNYPFEHGDNIFKNSVEYITGRKE